MLSLLKKKSEVDAAPAQPAWHPNFRNYEKLPDVKVVRTAFFINGVSVFLAVALIVYTVFREWQIRVIGSQVADIQVQVARNKEVSDQAIALYKKFQADETRAGEVETFQRSKPVVSALLLRLAQTLPKDIALDTFELRENGLTLRMSVRGDAAAASGHATAYLEQLRTDKELSLFDQFTFTSTPTRNPATGRMAVEFLLRLKPAAPAPGGKKS
jgi:hypothetical protein